MTSLTETWHVIDIRSKFDLVSVKSNSVATYGWDRREDEVAKENSLKAALLGAGSVLDRFQEHMKGGPMFPLDYEPLSNMFTADTMHELLCLQIEAFQNKLSDSDEVGVCLASFGKEIRIHVTGLGCRKPCLIVLCGHDESGRGVELLLHHSQVNLLLIAMKPLEGEKPNRIGFRTEGSSPSTDPSET